MEHGKILLESILERYQSTIGNDFERYKNHAIRIFLYARLFDSTAKNEDKYAIAAAFHDIGIWTAGTFDYLNPSINEALKYLDESGKKDWNKEITLMIEWHHKVRSYTGAFSQTVQSFRKADWIDVSKGFLTFGIAKANINAISKQIPNRGFHLFLLKQSACYFFRHPLHPLPMFRI